MENYMDMEVNSKQDFIKFVTLLHKNFLEKGNEWENNTLERFLKALSAYTNDIQGYYDNTQQDINADIPSWNVFANLLSGAVVYE